MTCSPLGELLQNSESLKQHRLNQLIGQGGGGSQPGDELQPTPTTGSGGALTGPNVPPLQAGQFRGHAGTLASKKMDVTGAGNVEAAQLSWNHYSQ